MPAEALTTLQTLLARVQARAAEPRVARAAVSAAVAGAPARPAVQSRRVELPGPDPVLIDEPFSSDSVTAPPSPELQRPTPTAPSVSLADDDIEEYDDELIELVEDSEPTPDVHELAVPTPSPTASPQARAPQGQPNLVVSPTAGAPSLERHSTAQIAPAQVAAAQAPVSPVVVSRAPGAGAEQVVQTAGMLPTSQPETFLSILDASLEL